MIDAGVF